MRTLPLFLVAVSVLACSRSRERHDVPPTSTVETRSAPLPTSDAPSESPSKTAAKRWLSGTVTLGDTGLTITLPDGFEIAESHVKGFWDVEGVYEHVGVIPHRSTIAGLMASSTSVPKASNAINSVCGDDRHSLFTLPMGKGGIFIKCSGEAKFMSIPGQKIITHKVRAFVPVDSPASESKSIQCYYEADKPKLIGFTETVCRSLKKIR